MDHGYQGGQAGNDAGLAEEAGLAAQFLLVAPLLTNPAHYGLRAERD